jgi:hypothetical protein
MKIDNPPSPPLRKGGMVGFESYFQGNFTLLLYYPHKILNNSL